MKTPSLALVTCPEHPGLPEDDRLLFEPLREAGLEPQIVSWDDPEARWETFDWVVLRAPWNYHLRLREFLAWLEARELAGTRLLNPAALVRWNCDKRYLKDLASRGIPIVPTRFIERVEATPLRDMLQHEHWDEAVLKPAVSAGAHQTVRITPAHAAEHEPLRQAIVASGSPAMLQPYVREVETEGEWSFLYFNRKFSHAVCKRPASGDFRVQVEFGGRTRLAEAPAPLRAAADKVIAAVSGPLLYARVDGIPVNGALQLGELEIIEPSLYLQHDSLAPARFVLALRELTSVSA